MHGLQMKRDRRRRKLVKTAAVGLLVALFSHPLVASGFEVKGIFDGHWEIDFARSESPSDKLRYLYDVTLSEHRRRLSASDSRLGDSPLTAMKDLRGLINLGRLGEQITRLAHSRWCRALEVLRFIETTTLRFAVRKGRLKLASPTLGWPAVSGRTRN